EEIRLLEAFAKDLATLLPSSQDWSLLLEYPIPRRNKFPDAILLAEELIFLIEFKFGAMTFDAASSWQVEDYALDLRDFHLESRGKSIIPILVATAADATQPPTSGGTPNPLPAVWPVTRATPKELPEVIAVAFHAAH